MKLLHLVNIRKKIKQKSQPLKILLSFFFIMIIFINFLYLNENFKLINSVEDNFTNKNEDNLNVDVSIPKTAADISLLQDPFTENFTLLRNFFENKYNSSLNYSISTYFRFGDGNGTITNDLIFSEDNLLLYKTLMQSEINQTETFDTYLKLQNTNLWNNGNRSNYDYGFIKSINGTTINGSIVDDSRYLYDNLLPIFLLIENIGDNIDDIIINGTTPKDSIDEMFSLINSTVFWDGVVEAEAGFVNQNESIADPIGDKYTESNFYAILANLLIHRTYEKLNISSTIADRAYDLANQTMIVLNKKMWNSTRKAFRHNANNVWSTTAGPQRYYHLSVNALGIITLLEYWIETGKNNASILQQAIDIYNSTNNYLWDNSTNFYWNKSTDATEKWGTFDENIDLKANAMMMSAALKLFEVTGNITYHDRAMEIYNSTEYKLLNWTNNAYNSSLTDDSKNFNYNLYLIEAYLKAYDIYTNTVLSAEYSVSDEVPEFVFNLDTMVITSTYSFNKIHQYYNPENKTYTSFTINSIITDASINYLFKYPNGSYLNYIPDKTTLSYPIPDTIPIDQGYYVYIWVDSEYFKMRETSKRFNVSSGLVNMSIAGFDKTIYQGPTIDVSFLINNTRSDNLTLIASLEGEDILNISAAQEINFTAFTESRIFLSFTVKLGTTPGISEIIFQIKRENNVYLEIKKVVEIGPSFDYSNLLYQNKVVKGDKIYISMNLINFLPTTSQSLNVSFIGITEDTIENFSREEVLIENEIKTVSYNLNTKESIKNNTIQIKMSILINTTEYYTELLTVEMVSKYEIMSVSFPEKIPQGTHGYLIIVIRNNQKNSEEFSLFINGKRVGANIDELATGENRIVKKMISTINPYELGKKTYKIVLKDNLDEEIAKFYFEIELEISTLNLVLFYIIPILIPIGIVLYFVNKDIKHKKLRR